MPMPFRFISMLQRVLLLQVVFYNLSVCCVEFIGVNDEFGKVKASRRYLICPTSNIKGQIICKAPKIISLIRGLSVYLIVELNTRLGV